MSALKLVRATVADRPMIFDFLRKSFFREEPVAVALGQADQPVDEDVDYILQDLHHGYSFLAFDDATLVGVAVNREATDGDLNVKRRHYEECEKEDLRKFHRFNLTVEEMADFWDRSGVKKVLAVENLNVDPAHTKKGIGVALLMATKSLGKELGYVGLRVDTSGHFSGRLMEKTGMKKVFALRYADYKGDDGRPLLDVAYPHTEFAIWYHQYD